MVLLEYLGPILGGLTFIVAMSFVREPHRRHFNAVFVAGAGAAYLSGGGFGVWELPYILVAACVVSYRGLRDYRYTGLAWLMHSGWDVLHHLYGNPLWPFLPGSSHGCAITDVVIALWFLAGAPTLLPLRVRTLFSIDKSDPGPVVSRVRQASASVSGRSMREKEPA